MADVAVAHPDLAARGGAESVAFHVLHALQNRHRVTLLTTATPDFERLNDYYDRPVHPSQVEVRTITPTARLLESRLSDRAYVLRKSLFDRRVSALQNEFDLLICTNGETTLNERSIQYVGVPVMDRSGHPRWGDSGSIVHRCYDACCQRISGFDRHNLSRHRLFTNSEWTRNVIFGTYGVEPEVLYPPVDTDAFAPKGWDERQSGFLTVGRIVEEKRVLQSVRIVDRLRERGHDIHLHIIGPIPATGYADQVRRAANDRPYVTLEGMVPRRRLVELFTTHRYGLHGREPEPFGIVVAEMVAAGMIPFVPRRGGPREIVGSEERLLYRSREEAVESIDNVLSSPSVSEEVLDVLPDPTPVFGADRFAERVRAAVAEEM